MNELSPEARRLLGLARRGDDPQVADRARVNQRMARRFALAAGVAGTALGTTKAAAGTAALSTLLVKGIVTGTIVVAAAAGTWKATEHLVSERRAAPIGAVVRTPMPQAVEQQRAKRSHAVEPPLADGAPLTDERAAPATSAQRDVAATSTQPDVTAPNQTKKTAARPEPRTEIEEPIEPSGSEASLDNAADPLQVEAAGLREVQQAMSQGQAARALRLIAEQDKRFGGGALAQERAAASIFALCSLGRSAEARTRAVTFETRWPRSPLISRVRRACDPEASN